MVVTQSSCNPSGYLNLFVVIQSSVFHLIRNTSAKAFGMRLTWDAGGHVSPGSVVAADRSGIIDNVISRLAGDIYLHSVWDPSSWTVVREVALLDLRHDARR
ncbi:hypothetical protein AVEN_71788-1 [Araneus ventricosus]|uniref:Uncharacterized protein n=1 Tax=Araneus ventricosus TaxID=182803 RepID=A0A4Y2R749_ARAVE|nr:hypothetical protein AVEN_71788-1 [Araneus ventricosus]